MKIEITREDIIHIIDKELGIRDGKRKTQMLAEYLWENGIIHNYLEIVEYCKRCWFFQTLRQVQDAFDMPGASWDQLLDREDIEYIDYESYPNEILVIHSV